MCNTIYMPNTAVSSNRLGDDAYYLMEMPKYALVAYAKKVKAALPHEQIFLSGRKADIAWSIVGAVARNPE